MDGIGSSNSSRHLNKTLVEILFTKPKAAARNGLGAGRKPSGGQEPDFQERMNEIKDLMETPAPAVAPQAQVPSSGQPVEGAVEDAAVAATSEDILTYAASMVQRQARATSSRVSITMVDISITEVTVESGKAEGQAQPQTCDPIVLDLNRDGRISTTSVEGGCRFDINGDGKAEQTAFVTGGDGALALDRDGDGKITSGLELFGDQHGSESGFAELSKFDDNEDGVIDKSDAVFSKLSVVTRGADGALVSRALLQYGLSEISLKATAAYAPLGGGSYISETGTALDAEGKRMLVADANFAYTV